MSDFMGYIYLFLVVCAIIVVIAFPIINAVKKRNRANMHLFDDIQESREEQKKRTSETIMESAIVIAIVYLVMFFVEFMKELLIVSPVNSGYSYLPIITITVVVSVIVIAIRSFRRKRSIGKKDRGDKR